MILDSQNLFSDAQAFTATAASTNIIDTRNTNRHGAGEALTAVVTIDVAADNTTTDEAYTFALQSSADAAFTTPITHTSKVAAAGSGAVTFSAGSRHFLPVPQDASVLRYLRVYATLAGTTPTVTATAFLQPSSMLQNEAYYPKGYTIS